MQDFSPHGPSDLGVGKLGSMNEALSMQCLSVNDGSCGGSIFERVSKAHSLLKHVMNEHVLVVVQRETTLLLEWFSTLLLIFFIFPAI